MFASNFIVKNETLTHVCGQDKLTTFTMTKTIVNGNSLTNYFCRVCGGLMYRVPSDFSGKTILRIGQMDGLELHETMLKP
jgi:Glutathione-dependent formaldehyde-activating enzyme